MLFQNLIRWEHLDYGKVNPCESRRFCEGLKDSVEMILGPQDYIHTAALTPEMGPEDFEKH